MKQEISLNQTYRILTTLFTTDFLGDHHADGLYTYDMFSNLNKI